MRSAPGHHLPVLLALALAVMAGCARDPSGAATADAGPAASAAATGAAPSATPPPEPSMPEPPMMSDPGATAPDTCDAELAKPAALGRTATPEVLEQARRDARATSVRVLRPGQVVTMEFVAGRLNVDVDDGNTIVNLRCG